MSACLEKLRRVKGDVSAVRAQQGKTREPFKGIDAVTHDSGKGDDARLRLPLGVPAGGAALHRFKGLQLGDHALDFDGHSVSLRCYARHRPAPLQG
jgi:hypothetical protein